MSDYYSNDQAFVILDCSNAFNALSDEEKFYAHYLSRAIWCGNLILFVQTSVESPLIFILFYKLFKEENVSDLKEKAVLECGFNADEFTALLIYVSAFISNCGNYRCFGDVKFVPNLDRKKLESLIFKSNAWSNTNCEKETWLSFCLDKIFSLSYEEKHLGISPTGVTTYLSKNVSQEDIKHISEFIKKKNFNPLNSRVFKTENEIGSCYEIRLGSVLSNDDAEDRDLISDHSINGHKFIFTRGDYSKLLKLVNSHLSKAEEYATNDDEKHVIQGFIHSFRTGSINAHIEASRHWVQTKAFVEMHIGFLNAHKDPARERAKFEGFVALVNKNICAKFKYLIDKANDILPLLPWPDSYENLNLTPPTFAYLDVLAYANCSVPIGKSLPNYVDIRESDGFKNFFLGNAVIANQTGQSPRYVGFDDAKLIQKYSLDALQIKIGLHEVLGHGCGKLFKNTADGLNFDENLIDLETEVKINSWYKEEEEFSTVFDDIAHPYEECRAESVALYMSTYAEVLQLFDYEGEDAINMCYILWLDTCLQGLIGLNTYDPETSSWKQAHCQGRFVILRILLEIDEFVKIEEVIGDERPDLNLSLDRSKIMTDGKQALGNFLKKIQLYKSTANVTKGRELFQKYSIVDDLFLKYRDIIVNKQIPRHIMIQPNTYIQDGSVVLRTYDANSEGIIQSWLDRYQDEQDLDIFLKELWQKDKDYFS